MTKCESCHKPINDGYGLRCTWCKSQACRERKDRQLRDQQQRLSMYPDLAQALEVPIRMNGEVV